VTIGYVRGKGRQLSFDEGHFELSDDWLAHNPPNSVSWRDHAVLALAGACAEELICGYRTGGVETDIGHATTLALNELDLGDPAFGPSRMTIEGAGPRDSNSGSQLMRETAFHIARHRFDALRDRTYRMVAVHRPEIERLAQLLLDGKRTLTGDEIVDAIDSNSERVA
jgi:hypothetical protein